jgi:N-methylhydantoinase A
VGELLTDLRADFSAPAVMDLGAEALPAIAEAFGLLRHRAAMWFSGHKIPAGGRCISRSIELRAAGQTGSLSLPLAEGPVTAATLEALAGQFVGTHRPPQGFLAGGGKLQIVAFHVEAVGRVPRPDFRPRPDAGPDASAARAGSRAVWLPEAGGWITCPVYDRDRLDAGNCLTGPAIVEQMDATTLILPGMTARVEPYLGLILQDEA